MWNLKFLGLYRWLNWNQICLDLEVSEVFDMWEWIECDLKVTVIWGNKLSKYRSCLTVPLVLSFHGRAWDWSVGAPIMAKLVFVKKMKIFISFSVCIKVYFYWNVFLSRLVSPICCPKFGHLRVMAVGENVHLYANLMYCYSRFLC